MRLITRFNALLENRLIAGSLWLRAWLMYCLLTFCASAIASEAILVIYDSKNELANEIISSLSQHLSDESVDIDLLDISSQTLAENATLQQYTSIITLGSQAAEAILNKNPPVQSLSLLVSKQAWSSFKQQKNNHSRSVILLDQPVDRQLLLIRELFGNNNTVGVLLGPYSSTFEKELTESARQQNQKISIKTIRYSDQLIPTLNNLTENADILLAIPDSVVYNKRSIQGILLLTYHNRTPVIGFSQAYTRAGAAASLFSSAEDIAQHTAEVIRDKSASSGIHYPKYFTITFNHQVARTLGISPPDAKQLIEHINRSENPRP